MLHRNKNKLSLTKEELQWLDQAILKYARVSYGHDQEVTWEDIQQETLLVLHRIKSQGGTINKSFVFKVVKNQCIDEYRKRESKLKGIGILCSQEEKAPNNDIETSSLIAKYGVAPDELFRVLKADELDAEDRILIQLHYIEGLTFENIGKVLKVHRTTAKRHTEAALLRFRNLIFRMRRQTEGQQ